MSQDMFFAVIDALRDEGRRVIPPVWLLDASNVVLCGLTLLAAYRTRKHPERVRSYILWAYGLLLVLGLPARSGDAVSVVAVASNFLQSALMLALAWLPADAGALARYAQERRKDIP